MSRLPLDALPAALGERARGLARLRDALAKVLDEAEALHFVGISTAAGKLVIFADSPIWCTRLRYRAAQFEMAAEPLLKRRPRISFRVQPPTFRAEAMPPRALSERAIAALNAAATSIDDLSLAAALRRLAGGDG